MKKKHSKITVIALLAIIMLFAAAGCGGGDDNGADISDDIDISIDEGDEIGFVEDAAENGGALLDEEEGDLLSEAELRNIYQDLDVAFNERALEDLTYDEVRDQFFGGVEGEKDPFYSSFDSFVWYMAGGKSEERGVWVNFDKDKGTAIGIVSDFPQ